jgi:release factor glutamine methyltransferase
MMNNLINQTYRKALQEAENYLAQKGVPDGDIDAFLLMSHVTGLDRGKFLLIRDEIVDSSLLSKYHQLIEKRGERIPLQHLIGETYFMGLPFKVNENVLIPRQDTEILVEQVLSDQEKNIISKKAALLDMCTGSGCIAISLKSLGDFQKADAIDLSANALEVATENASLNRADVTFIQSDLFENVPTDTYDVIVSNPPYIPTADIEDLEAEVKDHDPHMALDGFEDGLYFYRVLAKECPKYLKNTGHIYFEIGYDQGETVKNLLLENGFIDISILKDFGGNDRVVTAKKP